MAPAFPAIDVHQQSRVQRDVLSLHSSAGMKQAVGSNHPGTGVERLSGISWSADGRSWFVTSSSLRGSAILQVRLEGAVSELWRSGTILSTPLASPDGKNLAFSSSMNNSNAWVIENF
jgi:Tol biopolymer transport system component